MQREGGGGGRWLDRGLERIADLVVSQPRGVLAGAVVVLLLSASGAQFLEVDNSVRYWFAPSTQVRLDDLLLNEKLAGTATLRVLIEGEEENTLLDPEVLRAISDFEAFLEEDPLIGGVTSIASHVRRMNQALHDGDVDFYVVPDDAAVIGQYLFLYSMSAGPDGLVAFVDSDYRRTMIRALSKTDTAAFSRDLIARMERFASDRFRDLPVEVGIAGGTLGVQTALNDVVVADKIANIAQVGFIIFVLCAFLLRSLVGGLFVLTPLAVAVVFTLGLMGWSSTWLDMTTATITAMGISIGADFALYLIFRIREEHSRGLPLETAVRESLRTSGKAIFFVSSAVAAGYLVLPLSGFSIWIRLGVLTATMVSASALATLLMIPSMALTLRPGFLRGSEMPASPAAQREASPS
jgi:predicted RND superfamily exporter protein